MTCNKPGFDQVHKKFYNSRAEIKESFGPSLSDLKMARERRTGRILKVNTLLTSVIAEEKGTLECLRGFTSWLEDWVWGPTGFWAALVGSVNCSGCLEVLKGFAAGWSVSGPGLSKFDKVKFCEHI